MSRKFRLFAATSFFFACWNTYALSDIPEPQPAPQQTLSFYTPPGAHFILGGGLTYGGDTLTTAVYTDGTTKDIKAGSLVQLGMGMLWQASENPIALQLIANYHFDGASGSNGSITFKRYPLEGLVYYTKVERMRFGLGARYVLSPRYEDKVGVPFTVNFDNTVGVVGEFGYAMTPVLWMNFRVVSEKYQHANLSFSGNHAGINFIYRFE
ncbi:MAG: hypothetical protein PHP05_03180 [Sideroxydans sp.]|nr:hypothetical protein [Sideroxydans sp.]